MLPMQSVDLAIEEMRYAHETLGMRGGFLRPNPYHGKKMISDPMYEPFWTMAEDLGFSIGFHEGSTTAMPTVGVDRFDKSFLAELAAVARLRHRNLVRLRGWCVRDGEELLLVYDYMPNRSLDRLLFSPSAASAPAALGWDRRRRIVAGLAAALLYLHEQLDTQIIHRDVKTSNVMLDSEYNARLGDFGLARWLEHAVEDAPPTKKNLELLPSTPSVRSTSSFSSSANYQFRLIDTSRIGGTIGYLPPESFQPRGGATAKSDVFSFGIVLLEVATGRRAVDLAYPDDQIFMLDWVRRLSDEGKLLNAGDRKLPQGGMFDMVRFIHLGLLCSMHDPRSRPTMKWVVENISGSSSGDLPPLPSFVAHPKYISLTSSSSDDSGTSTTIAGTNSTASPASSPMKPMYATATGTTIYLTAEDGNKTLSGGGSGPDRSGNSQRSSLSPRPVVAVPNVDTPREISYKEIVAITNDFSESQVVAELDFGTGYEGFLDNGRGGRIHVLVKRLGMKTCPALRTRFANELCNLAKLRHRNLVQLRGWCTDHGEMLVVYNHSPGNLLSNHLLVRHSDSETLSWRHQYGIDRQGARVRRAVPARGVGRAGHPPQHHVGGGVLGPRPEPAAGQLLARRVPVKKRAQPPRGCAHRLRGGTGHLRVHVA
jgi:serine/threonine protein kinase